MDALDSHNEYLAAVVESSDDAIITKDLNSIIRTWNMGAESIFGFTSEEAIGQPITMIIPEGRLHEELNIINKLRNGERIRHFETERRRKDGNLVPISLTVSPVRNAAGQVIGASKIARDISQQKEAADRQKMLLAEMRHRVGNCFAVAGSLITVRSRQVNTASELATQMRDQLHALSSAHRLAVADPTADRSANTLLHELVLSTITPFSGENIPDLNIENVRIVPNSVTPLALIFYELCTNAVKYGALGQNSGRVSVATSRRDGNFIIDWQECCQIDPKAAQDEGFGTQLCQNVAKNSLGGSITRYFETSGMRASIVIDIDNFEAQ